MSRKHVHRLVIAVLAAGFLTSVGYAAAVAQQRATTMLPIVDGSRVMKMSGDTVYFVDDGELRPMRYAAYKNLFRGWGGIGKIGEVPEEMLGETMTGKTRLVRVKGERHVWLIDNGKTRRHVREMLDFSRKLIEPVAWSEILEYPEGPSIGGPTE